MGAVARHVLEIVACATSDPERSVRLAAAAARVRERTGPTEAAVVDLVAEGLSNPRIAERLVIEVSTVKTHLHHVFRKLGVTTRAQLAAAATARRAGRAGQAS